MKKLLALSFAAVFCFSTFVIAAPAAANEPSSQVVRKSKTVYRHGRRISVTTWRHGRRISVKTWHKGHHIGKKVVIKTKHVIVGPRRRRP